MISSVYLAFVIASLDTLAFSTLLTTMDRYVYSIGGTQFFLGILGSSIALLILITNPIVGSFGDRLGRKKVLQYSMLNCIITNFIIASIPSLPVIFLARIISAFSSQNMSLVKSFLDDNIKSKSDKDRIMDQMQSVSGIQFIVGALMGGFLSELNNGNQTAFYVISAIYGLAFAFVCLIEEHPPKSETKPQQRSSMYSKLLKSFTDLNWSKYWLLFTIKLLIDMAFSVNFFNLANTLMNTYSLSGKEFGYVFATMSIISVIAGVGLMKLKKFLYANDAGFTRILHAAILLLVSFSLAAVTSSFTAYFISLIPLFVARTLHESTMTEMILSYAAPNEKGSILGAFDNTMALAGLIAPLLCGTLTSIWDASACTYLSIALSVASIAMTSLQKQVAPSKTD